MFIKNKIKNRDIIIVGLQPWDTSIGSNCKNIAEEFSKQNRVLYVNYALDRITSLREKDSEIVKARKKVLNSEAEDLIKIKENLWVFTPKVMLESINKLSARFVFDLFNKRNNRLLANEIKRAASILSFSDFILFNDNDIFRGFYLKEYLNPSVYVYYSRDYLLAVDYWKQHGSSLEPQLMSKADLVLANSIFLKELAVKYNQNSFDVGQGCDFEGFDKYENQKPNNEKPVIGYVGYLTSLRLDVELLEKLAQLKKEWDFVFVGPKDKDFESSSLNQMDNVSFLGQKPVSDLPKYISSFDVCINPQIVNEVTIGNYPRKIDEYLYMGKPTVATKTKAMEAFKDYVYLAENVDDYIVFISDALKNDSEKLRIKRKLFASQHTWKNSVGKIYSAINLVSYLQEAA